MLSKTCGYAIRGILYVAQKSQEDKKIGIKEIAEALDIPQPFLGKIMQILVRNSILKSTKGPNGGFYCNQETLQTPLIKIVEIIDGVMAFKQCALGLNHCSEQAPCPLHFHIKTYRDNIYAMLKEKKIKDLEANNIFDQ